MKILYIARSTLYGVYGGDTVQIVSTAKYLRRQGVIVDIKLSHEKINYKEYDLLHLFNITRPADAFVHVENSGLPYVISTIFLDHEESQKADKGIRGMASKYISADKIEYVKTIARWLKNGESIKSRQYLYYGHKGSIVRLVNGASMLLPNSENEYIRFVNRYQVTAPHTVIYNGIDTEVFGGYKKQETVHDPMLVLCVGRIEGNKNQLNLIRALNDTPFKLKLVGKPAPNHMKYYEQCRKAASDNISFEGFISQEELIRHYMSAKVHVLPSWNETCGLSSMEAAYMNCNIVISAKGDTVEYYGNDAWYCDPGSPQSIYDAVVKASEAPLNDKLHDKILTEYNWQKAAIDTLMVYKEVLNMEPTVKMKEVHPYEEQIKVTI